MMRGAIRKEKRMSTHVLLTAVLIAGGSLARQAAPAPADPDLVLSREDVQEVRKPAHHLGQVTVAEKDGAALVQVRADGEIGKLGILELKNPARLALDLRGVSGRFDKVAGASFVVAISDFCSAQIRRWSNPEEWNKIHVVRCTVDDAFFDQAMPVAPNSKTFICVGRLSAQKGQLLLLEAAARLKATGAQFELVLAGDGEMRTEVDQFISKQHLGSIVRVTGWIDGGRIRQELLAATALVLPSFAEGLPVVIMEAMALRRPVISTYVAGIPELVRADEHGWLVPAGDVEALVQAMQACIDCPNETLERMGNAARGQVLLLHHADNEASQLKRHLNRAIETSSIPT